MSGPPSWLDDPPIGVLRGRDDRLGDRTFRQLADDRFELDAPDHGVSFEIARLRRERGSLVGELTVRCDLAGAPTFEGILSAGDLYLTNPKARQERARLLAERSRTSDLDFASLLEELALRVIAVERKGQPSILLRNAPRPSPDDILEVEGMPLLRRHPLILFGPGGVAKSLLSLWILGTLAQRGLQVCLFDWELAAEEHRERFERLFGTNMPPLRYVHCARPLAYEADRIRRVVADDEIQYAGFDSVAFGCDGPPEAAEVATRYMGVVRSLGIGSLLIAHTNKSERADEAPFGSSFWHNAARSTWHIKAADPVNGADALNVGLFHKKANLGRKRDPIGFELTFETTRTLVRRTDLTTVDGLADKLPLRQRIVQALRHGTKSINEIAAEIDAEHDTVKRTINRYSSGKLILFCKLPGADGQPRVGLTDRKTS